MDGQRVRRILDLSRRVERARQGELANARREREAAEDLLSRARQEETAQLAALTEGGELPPEALLDRARYVALAAQQVKTAQEVFQVKDGEVDARQAAVFEATRDVRKFEVLNEKHRHEAKAAAKQAEQRELDDLSARRGGR